MRTVNNSSSSSSEEGELSEDPQEAAMESGQTAGGSPHLRQPGKQKTSMSVNNVSGLVAAGNRVGGNVQGGIGGGGRGFMGLSEGATSALGEQGSATLIPH